VEERLPADEGRDAESNSGGALYFPGTKKNFIFPLHLPVTFQFCGFHKKEVGKFSSEC
jgi:hypothetical protein